MYLWNLGKSRGTRSCTGLHAQPSQDRTRGVASCLTAPAAPVSEAYLRLAVIVLAAAAFLCLLIHIAASRVQQQQRPQRLLPLPLHRHPLPSNWHQLSLRHVCRNAGLLMLPFFIPCHIPAGHVA